MDPLWDQEGLLERIQGGDEYLATAPEGRREVFTTSILDGSPQHVTRLPGPTFLPMIAAFATAVVFIGVLISAYTAAAAGAAAFLLLLLYWLWEPPPEKPSKDAGKGLHLPIDLGDHTSTGWAGAVVFLLVDAAMFASLVYSYFYLWTVSEIWPPAGYRPLLDLPALIGLALLLGCLPAAAAAHVGASSGQPGLAMLALALIIVLLLGLVGAGYWTWLGVPFTIDSHADGAMVAALAISVALHALLAAGAAGFALARIALAGMTPERSLPVRIAALLAFYAILQGVIVYAVVYLSPDATG